MIFSPTNPTQLFSLFTFLLFPNLCQNGEGNVGPFFPSNRLNVAIHLQEVGGAVVGVEQRRQKVCLARLFDETIEDFDSLRRVLLYELLRWRERGRERERERGEEDEGERRENVV